MDYYKEIRNLVGNIPLILPGSVVLIMNNEKQILLQKRSDGSWGLPGGLMNTGESLEETAIREVKEETGLFIFSLKLLGVFSGDKYYFKLENGDEIFSVTAVYFCKDYTGNLKIDGDESLALEYFDVTELPLDLTEEYKSYISPFVPLFI